MFISVLHHAHFCFISCISVTFMHIGGVLVNTYDCLPEMTRLREKKSRLKCIWLFVMSQG